MHQPLFSMASKLSIDTSARHEIDMSHLQTPTRWQQERSEHGGLGECHRKLDGGSFGAVHLISKYKTPQFM